MPYSKPMDILVFALVTAILLFRLYQVLGRRDGFERPPEIAPVPRPRPAVNIVVGEEETAPQTLAGRIAQIHRADPSFDEKKFLRGARAAFDAIMSAFSAGDKKTLRNLLSPQVFAHFEEAIDARTEQKHTIEAKIVRLRDPDISEARLEGEEMYITVTFHSEQISATVDADGKVVDGDRDRIYDVTDIWTFRRKIGATSPTWYLTETKTG